MTRLTGAASDAVGGRNCGTSSLKGSPQSDAELSAYLQRLGGYCVRGVASKDVLAYFFGVGSNGKSSFAEALAPRASDYAMALRPKS